MWFGLPELDQVSPGDSSNTSKTLYLRKIVLNEAVVEYPTRFIKHREFEDGSYLEEEISEEQAQDWLDKYESDCEIHVCL